MNEEGGSDRNTAAAPEGADVRVLEIVNKKGLHARASAKFCQIVERFDADVRVVITVVPVSFVAVDAGLTQKEIRDLTDLMEGRPANESGD